jgi:molybdenum cofactor cytidylyltransferase
MSHLIEDCGVLIVAAGESKRLGTPKQLLQFEGQSLINRLVNIVRDAGSFPITIVLGAEATGIQAQLPDVNLHVVINEEWREGMGSSIRVGLKKMIEMDADMDGVMILVCDQPFIKSESIQSLIQMQQSTGLPMAACFYEGIVGTPALFHQYMFSDLLQLSGDTGAKKMMKDKMGDVAKLNFEKGVIDIDTMEDYQKIIQGEK